MGNWQVITGLVLLAVLTVAKAEEPQAEINKTPKTTLGIAWEAWINSTEAPAFMKIYIFNVTNPNQVLGGSKPVLKELGPYVYQETRERTNFAINDATGTATFCELKTYQFQPDLSNGSEEDSVTIPNVPLISMLSIASSAGEEAQEGLKQVLTFHKEELFTTLKAEEALFKGKYLLLLKTFKSLTGIAPLPDFTYGVFYKRNGSACEEMEVSTGAAGDDSKIGEILSWKGAKELSFWKGKPCTEIQGTDGLIFQPSVNHRDKLKFLSPDLCRSFSLEFEKEKIADGIQSLKFAVPPTAWEGTASGKSETQCYCTGTESSGCLKTGALPITDCNSPIPPPFSKWVPLVLSNPHFLDGLPSYANGFIGLKEDRESHSTHVLLEPRTGTVLESHSRIQINVRIDPENLPEEMEKVPRALFPILWYDRVITASNATRDQIIEELGYSHLPNTVAPEASSTLSDGSNDSDPTSSSTESALVPGAKGRTDSIKTSSSLLWFSILCLPVVAHIAYFP